VTVPRARRSGLELSLAALAATTAALGTPGPERHVLGPPRGAAALDGVGGARDRSSVGGLPRAPRVLWTRSIAGGITCNMLADDAGRLIALGPGRLSQLGTDGSLELTRSYPFARPIAAALMNDGTRVLLTETPELIGLSERGALRFNVRLSGVNLASPSLLPLWDGGVLVTLGAWVLSYDARGGPTSSVELDERVRVSLQSGRDVILVGARGGVYRWIDHGGVRRVGAFGRGVLDATLSPGGSLVASLAADELAELSLASGQVTPLRTATPLPGAAHRTLDGSSWLSTTASGALLMRRGGEPSSTLPELSATPLLWLQDAEGTLVTASAPSGLVFHRADDSRETLPLRCSEPLSLVPTRAGRIALGCRSGELWLIGEDGSPAEPSRPTTTGQ
jgi:hypothetical protein